MSNFVFSLLICCSESLLVLWGEFKVLHPHPSAPYNTLVSSFDFVLLCSFVFCCVLSHVSNLIYCYFPSIYPLVVMYLPV